MSFSRWGTKVFHVAFVSFSRWGTTVTPDLNCHEQVPGRAAAAASADWAAAVWGPDHPHARFSVHRWPCQILRGPHWRWLPDSWLLQTQWKPLQGKGWLQHSIVVALACGAGREGGGISARQWKTRGWGCNTAGLLSAYLSDSGFCCTRVASFHHVQKTRVVLIESFETYRSR